MGQFTSWSQDLRITADGQGVVALAGAVGLRMLADRSGLTAGLSQVLTVRGFTPVHDRGRVLADVAVAIGCGGRDLVDVEALRTQQQIFGPVASDTTAGRALGEVGERRRAAIAAARAAARAHMWGQLPGGVPESRSAGGQCQPGTVVLRIDGTLIPAHSRKDKAAGTLQKVVRHAPAGLLGRQHR